MIPNVAAVVTATYDISVNVQKCLQIYVCTHVCTYMYYISTYAYDMKCTSGTQITIDRLGPENLCPRIFPRASQMC